MGIIANVFCVFFSLVCGVYCGMFFGNGFTEDKDYGTRKHHRKCIIIGIISTAVFFFFFRFGAC